MWRAYDAHLKLKMRDEGWHQENSALYARCLAYEARQLRLLEFRARAFGEMPTDDDDGS
jgi:hypothetical protein